MNVDELWDVLREVACTTKPFTDAHAIVMLKKPHVRSALKLLAARKAQDG